MTKVSTNKERNNGWKNTNLPNETVGVDEMPENRREKLAGRNTTKVGFRENQELKNGIVSMGEDGNEDKQEHLAGSTRHKANVIFPIDLLNINGDWRAQSPVVDPNLPRKPTGCRMITHVLLYVFIFGNDVADFFSDWLFFADVKVIERGLVYGKPESAVVWCLLLFSIIGTITFIVECVNLWWEFFRNNPWFDSDWLSAIVIWIEDIPQVVLSMYLVLCREDPISIFQLLKAAVILCSVVIRIVITAVKYCNKNAIKSHYHVKIKAAIMLGIIIEAVVAGVIFFMTQTERANSGEVSFKVPSTIVEETYNDRYLTDVSLFVHNAGISGVGVHDPNKIDWINLDSILNIKNVDHGEISFKIEYRHIGNMTNLGISDRLVDSSSWRLSECYSIDKNTAKITPEPNSSCSQAFSNDSSILFIKLRYEHPGYLFKVKVYGDVQMNIMKKENNVCTSVTEYADSIESSFDQNIPLAFHYYRLNETLHDENIKHLLHESGTPRFFQHSDLIDINKVWKTGWRECDGGGHTAPIFNKDITLSCS